MQKIIHTRKTIIMLGILLGSMLIMNGNVAFADDTPNTEDPSVTTKIPYVPGTTEYTLDNDMTFRVKVADIPALEITLPSSIVSLDLVPDANTADFNSTDISILVGTTNTTGYTLSMIPSSTNLTRTESINNTTPVISTLDNVVAPNVFSSTVDNTTMNKWGYKLASTNMTNADTTNYHPITTTAIPINESNAAIYNDSTTISFAAKANSEIPGGNYRATLKFMAVSNINTYSIMYNAGSASSDSTLANMPSPNPQTGALEGGGSTTIVLSSAAPSRTGYSFINWCSVNPTTSNNTDSCNGTTYSAGGNMEISNSEPDVNLYAMWGVDTYAINITNSNTTSSASSIYVPYGGSATVTVTPSSGYYLSNVSCPEHYTCTGYNTGTSYTGQQTVTITNNNYAGGGTVGFTGTVSGYTLSYDGNGGTGVPSNQTGAKTYTIPNTTPLYRTASTTNTSTRYATFSSWNTKADGTGTSYAKNASITLTEDTTLYAQWTFNSGTLQNTSTSCASNMIDARTGVSYLTYTISGRCYMEQNLYLPTNLVLYPGDSNVTRNWTTPTSSAMPSNSYATAYMVTGTHTNNKYNATGGWYNYCAASAGTVCNSTTQANAAQDVCPKGWKLPTDAQMVNVKNANRSNWKFYAGHYYDGSLQSASTHSYWWSATADNAYRYFLYYYNGSLYTNSYHKNYGYFVRCVRK